MLFADNMQWHIYIGCTCIQLLCQPHSLLLTTRPLLHLSTPLFTYLENQLFLLAVRIPIHSCPWFAINCSPLAAWPTPRHPTDQVTYLHRRHQQHQPSRLIHFWQCIVYLERVISLESTSVKPRGGNWSIIVNTRKAKCHQSLPRKPPNCSSMATYTEYLD